MCQHVDEKLSFKNLTPAFVVGVLSFLCLVALTFRPPEIGKQAAVVFPPSTSFAEAATALAKVDARPIRTGAWSAIVVADFKATRHFANLDIPGAWLVLDPVAVGGCFGGSTGTRESALSASF